ncbi:hypothetical protein EON82_09335 [bacterium]|nr:MAG: hypothetical protein EON82_09335 [bacterium]
MRRTLVLLPILLLGCGGGGSGSKGRATLADLTSWPMKGVVTDLTADGQVVFGKVFPDTDYGYNAQGARWALGPAEAIDLGDFVRATSITAASADGSVLLGTAWELDGPFHTIVGPPKMVLINVSNAYTEVPLPEGITDAGPVDISADGSVVLGAFAASAMPLDTRPFVVRDGVATPLPLPEGVGSAPAVAISADGRTVIGRVEDRPAIWVDGGQPQFLSEREGEATAVSADGKVVVGVLRYPQERIRAFRWTSTGGTQVLDLGPGFTRRDSAAAVSGDGRTVLLSAFALPDGDEPILWRVGKGAKRLRDILAAGGVDVSAYNLTAARLLSADGKTIVGAGRTTNSMFVSGPWKVVLP